MAESLKNNRKHNRLKISLRAELVLSSGELLSGWTKDISFGGAYIFSRSSMLASVGAEARLRLMLESGRKLSPIEIVCKIVRTDQDGVGVKLVSIDMEGYIKFKNLMLYNNPNPDILLAELQEDPGLQTD